MLRYKHAKMLVQNIKDMVTVEVADFIKERGEEELELNFKNGDVHYEKAYVDVVGTLNMAGYEEYEVGVTEFDKPVSDIPVEDVVYLLKVLEEAK